MLLVSMNTAVSNIKPATCAHDLVVQLISAWPKCSFSTLLFRALFSKLLLPVLVFFCYCDACLKSSTLCVGVKALHNTMLLLLLYLKFMTLSASCLCSSHLYPNKAKKQPILKKTVSVSFTGVGSEIEMKR